MTNWNVSSDWPGGSGSWIPSRRNRMYNGAREEAAALTREAAAASFVLDAKPGRDPPLRPRQADHRCRHWPQRSRGSHARRGQRPCRPPLYRLPAGWHSRHARKLGKCHTCTRHPGRRDAHGARWASRHRPFHGCARSGECVCSMLPTKRLGRRHMNSGKVFSFGDFGPGTMVDRSQRSRCSPTSSCR